ncbi:hypothetical protein SUGI_0260460 [Cryptomeria japonica]|uniref:uncharacterized protein LOC131047881 n=1 Tax=Cryptomeria japonica TaxID=3369 RepID=UPI002408C32A|nr:uncharacterized protein LOC131047881 [Cryptomeria japonica]GLJ15800.1 hypothetical protein SUGI_0260460 [Cryptomeria japonica]
MSALVCGKRSVFEDLHTPPPISKRLRCSSGGNSPIRTFTRTPSPTPPPSVETDPDTEIAVAAPTYHSDTHIHTLSHLKRLFPHMDEQHLQAVLESCGNDLASAIKSLNELQLGSNERDSSSCGIIPDSSIGSDLRPSNEANRVNHFPVKETDANNAEGSATALPVNGSDWVQLLLQEMQNASDMDDARLRASRALVALENAIVARTGSIAENLQKENLLLKQQVEGLFRDNSILKRAVTIQHERQKEHEERGRELQNLKQLLSQYQEQLRTLEVNNYALTLHLRQAQESNSIPGRFHPDVF